MKTLAIKVVWLAISEKTIDLAVLIIVYWPVGRLWG